MKHNIAGLKGWIKKGGDDVSRLWVDFETRLNMEMQPKDLDPFMLSTTIVARKP
jgi:hypothetical protein